jgi:hypothetical protein
MAIGRLCGGAGEIPASQHLTRFYRRLAERIDAQKMSSENGFHHEMHLERAKRPLVQRIQVDGSDRAAMNYATRPTTSAKLISVYLSALRGGDRESCNDGIAFGKPESTGV